MQVFVSKNGKRLTVMKGDEMKDYEVSIVWLYHDNKRLGSVFDAVLFVKSYDIKEVKAPDGNIDIIARLNI